MLRKLQPFGSLPGEQQRSLVVPSTSDHDMLRSSAILQTLQADLINFLRVLAISLRDAPGREAV